MDRVEMKTAMTGGLALGGLLAVWPFVLAGTGWYLSPNSSAGILIAGFVQFVVLFAVLQKVRDGNRYGRQVGVGLITSGVAAVLAFLGALIATGVVFPEYFSKLEVARREFLLLEGRSPEEIQELIEKLSASQTPGGHAFAMFMGTLAIGFIASSLIAIFVRDRDAANPS